MLRAARALAVLAAITASVACQTVEDPLPPQAALNFDITDSAVASQLNPLPSPQVAFFRVDEMSASDFVGFDGTYSFLYSGPCSYQLNALLPVPFPSACRTSGLTVKPGPELLTAKLSVTLSRLELRVAARPDLSGSGDPDGDGVPNTMDNCPIQYNPDQENVNRDLESLKVGDACSQLDTNDEPTIPDQDLDGVRDSIDNCFWYPNPLLPDETSPPDSTGDGIGDACERIAPVVLQGGKLTIVCDDVSFTAQPSKIAYFRMDFGRPGVLTCDAGFTGCTINPSALKLSLVGSTTTFDCHEAP